MKPTKLLLLRIVLVMLALLTITGLALPAIQNVRADDYDGRLNRLTVLWPGIAVYCVDANKKPNEDWTKGGIQVLLDNDTDGYEMLYVTAAQIKAAIALSEKNTKNQQIKLSHDVILSYLTTGEFQINAPLQPEKKRDVFHWRDCAAEGLPEVLSTTTLVPVK